MKSSITTIKHFPGFEKSPPTFQSTWQVSSRVQGHLIHQIQAKNWTSIRAFWHKNALGDLSTMTKSSIKTKTFPWV